MKKTNLSTISLLLVIIMIASALASCGGGGNVVTTEKPSEITTEDQTTESTEATTNSDEEPTEDKTEDKTTEETTEKAEEIVVENPHDALIQNANSLANGVQSYFSDSTHRAFTIKNQNMTLEYMLNASQDQLVTYINNTQGKSYIQKTMDVFIKMTNGDVIYSSQTSVNALPNIYRLGYYYYENRFEGQDFGSGIKIFSEQDVPFQFQYTNDISSPTVKDGVMSFAIKNNSDPSIEFKKFSYSADELNYVQITIKAPATDTARSATVFVMNNNDSYYAVNGVTKSKTFALHTDGEFHTYTILLSDIKGYNGTVTGFRLDINSSTIKETYEVSEIKFVKGELIGVDTLSTARIFHTYSDKLHQEIQVAASEDTSNIAEVGMLTQISADTVAKLVVKDKNGLHETLEGVDWDSAEYAAFDIKDVGIFGYILPVHETAGQLTITLENGKYNIVQTRVPENNTILAGEGDYTDQVGKIGNGNDFFISQRIYTDENHDFDKFLKEAYIERNPLTAKNIKVSSAYSDMGKFVQYDAVRGAYEFYISGTDFNSAYYIFPNRQYNLNFTIKGDEYERNIYVLATNSLGSLETAALLDENLMLLPVPMEVCKNFGSDGDVNIFDRFDLSYSETIFPIMLIPDQLKEYNLVNLYQNWGNFPLKQISSIEFTGPYYHMSTGVTESNCLVPWGWTTNEAIQNDLPDHRAMSAPLWEHQPQHTFAGSHKFTKYVDIETGLSGNTEIVQNIIDSYGPTYSDLKMVNVADNGKFTATISHIEVPQLDENRAYYIMEYVFNEDMSFKDFKNQFTFYDVTDRLGTPNYKYYGYLNENNECVVEKTSNKENNTLIVLGDECPYFSFFYVPTDESYCNPSVIIKDYSVIINCEETDTRCAIRKDGEHIRLTLNLAAVTFKAGDKITLNAIILPWGSEKSDYSGEIYAPDQNVRDVRENSCLNPIVATAGENCEVLDSVFIPKVKTTNGKSAEFTISGGKKSEYDIPYRDEGYNMVVRAYGFDKLSVPKVYEKVNGEWVEYALSSASNPDKYGYCAYYDGYSVYYDEDGTYSYAFVFDMSEAEPRTFKIELVEDFEKWPRVLVEEPDLNPLDCYYSALEVKGAAGGVSPWFTSMELAEDNGVQYLRFVPHKTRPESYFNLFKNNDTALGQYLIIKYRTNMTTSIIQWYSSTQYESADVFPSASFSMTTSNGLYIADEQWHIVVLDLSKIVNSFTANSDGEFAPEYLRLDIINWSPSGDILSQYVDVAYVGMSPDFEEIITMDDSAGDILFYDGSLKTYDPTTGNEK